MIAPATTARTMQVADPVVPGSATMPVADDALLPQPVDQKQVAMSMELLVALMQEAEGKNVGTQEGQASIDQKERQQKLQEALKKIDEEAKARNSPGFFKAVFRVVKDFASDLFTDPKLLVSDLGKNLHEMMTSPNFWSDLKAGCMAALKVVAVVAAVAATIVTCGSASPLLIGAILVLSAASAIDSQFHVLAKLGVDPKIAGFIDLGMGLAAAVLTLGASAGSSASQLMSAAKTIKEATTGIQIGTTVMGGVASGVNGGFEKARLDRAADRKAIDGDMDQLQEQIEELLSRIRTQYDGMSAQRDAVDAAAASQANTMQILTGVRA